MPPVAKVAKAEAISSGLTPEVPVKTEVHAYELERASDALDEFNRG